MIVITSAAGFIGSNFVLNWLEQSDEAVINLDALTYIGNLESGWQAIANRRQVSL